MKTLKLKHCKTGKIRYYYVNDDYPAEVGEHLVFKNYIRYTIIKILQKEG